MDSPNPAGGSNDWLALLDQLPEEQKKAWLALANVPQQQTDIDEQMKRADALNNKPGGQPYGLAAGLLSGIGQGLNAYASQKMLKESKAERAALYKQLTGTRADVVGTMAQQQARAAALAGQQQAAPGPYPQAPQMLPQDMSGTPPMLRRPGEEAPPSPFGFGGQ